MTTVNRVQIFRSFCRATGVSRRQAQPVLPYLMNKAFYGENGMLLPAYAPALSAEAAKKLGIPEEKAFEGIKDFIGPEGSHPSFSAIKGTIDANVEIKSLLSKRNRELYYRDIEANLTDELTACKFDFKEILKVARRSLQDMGISGVNIYLYNRENGEIKSILRDKMAGNSRYQDFSPLLPGEKKHFIESGNDAMLFDRSVDISHMRKENLETALRDCDADNDRYFMNGITNSPQWEALRENIYLRFAAHNGYDVVIQANNHGNNLERVRQGKQLSPLFKDPYNKVLFFKIARMVGNRIGMEMQKAYLKEELDLSNKQLDQSNKQLHLVDRLHTLLDQMDDVNEIFTAVLEAIPEQFKAGDGTPVTRASIMTWNEKEEALIIALSIGLRNEFTGSMIKSGEGVAGTVFSSGRPMIVDDVNAEEEFLKIRPSGGERSEGSLISVPIKGKNQTLGVLSIRSPETHAFNRNNAEHLERIANILGDAVVRARLINMLTFDEMTGFYNRKPGIDAIEEELKKTREGKGGPFTLALFDIDEFKSVNDNFGHEAGDSMIKAAAAATLSYLTDEDVLKEYPGLKFTAIRPGGDEFVIGFNGVPPEKVFIIMERIRERFRTAGIEAYGKSIKRTLSAGIAEFPEHGLNYDSLVRSADTAMYNAKERGKDRTVKFVDGMVLPKK